MNRKNGYKVEVTTGDFKYAGTDSDVSIVFVDINDVSSGPHKLDKWLRNDFERGNTDDFHVKTKQSLDELAEIELIFSGSDWWYCDKIEIQPDRGGDKSIFPVHRWFRHTMSLKVAPFDSYLPQHSRHPEQRKRELEEKRKSYEYTENYPGLPVQVKNMPNQESFSDDFKWDMLTRKFTLIGEKIWYRIFNGTQDFKSLDEVVALFDEFPSLEVPEGVENWRDDFHFGDRRLNGCNPKIIKLCTQIPSNFKVEADRVEPFLEGSTLQSAIEAKRVFIVDLKVLEGIQTVKNAILCKPLALFYLTSSQRIRPIAIQLFQSGDPNPVFYPSDEENLWTLVKMWYNNADASFHQSCVHLCSTHLLMEGITVCANRHLSPSHPIYKLLAPHFLYIMAINTLGLQKLISVGGWVDNTMTVGREGMLQLMAKNFSQFSLEIDGDFKQDLKRRGLLEDILPNYHYRADGLLIYEAISKYVERMVKYFYNDVEDIKNDYEIQGWAKELAAPRRVGQEEEIGGLGIKGVPGNGKFDNYEDLIALIRLIIFTCSCEHAAVNFNQYDNYAFPPAYPALLYGEPPSDRRPRTEDDLLKALPKKQEMMDTMVITKILSTPSTQSLGDFEMKYHHKPEVLTIVDDFIEDLGQISQQITADLPNRNSEYSILDPNTVPNSISI